MMLIQPYGIQVWGDLLGTLSVLGIYGSTAFFRPSVRKWTVIVLFLYSAWGSLTVIPRAMMRFDAATMAYHLCWVIGMLWVVAKIWTPPWDETLLSLDAWRARTVVRLFDLFDREEKGGDHERL